MSVAEQTFEHMGMTFNFDHESFMNNTLMNQVAIGPCPPKHKPFFFFKDKQTKKLEAIKYGDGFIKHIKLLMNKMDHALLLNVMLGDYHKPGADIVISEDMVMIPQDGHTLVYKYQDLDSGEVKIFKSFMENLFALYCIDVKLYKQINKACKRKKAKASKAENIPFAEAGDFTSDTLEAVVCTTSDITSEDLRVNTEVHDLISRDEFDKGFSSLNVEFMTRFFKEAGVEMIGATKKEHRVQAISLFSYRPTDMTMILQELIAIRDAAISSPVDSTLELDENSMNTFANNVNMDLSTIFDDVPKDINGNDIIIE